MKKYEELISISLSPKKEDYFKNGSPTISEQELIESALEISGISIDMFIRNAIRSKAIEYIEAAQNDKTHKDILITNAMDVIHNNKKEITSSRIRLTIGKLTGIRSVSEAQIKSSLRYLNPAILDTVKEVRGASIGDAIKQCIDDKIIKKNGGITKVKAIYYKLYNETLNANNNLKDTTCHKLTINKLSKYLS